MSDHQLAIAATDPGRIFVLHPGSASEVSHFLKKQGRSPWFRPAFFHLLAIQGIVADGLPVSGGGIAVAFPDGRWRSAFTLQIVALGHEEVAGISEFLIRAAAQASRCLGYHLLVCDLPELADALIREGFTRRNGGWVLTLTHGAVEATPERPALPESDFAAQPSIDV